MAARLLATPSAAAAAVAAAVLAATLAGCGNTGSSEDYFPLDAGRSWTYRVTTAMGEDQTRVESLTISNRAAENMGGSPATRRHVNSGIDYWLRSDASGIVRIASRAPLDRNALADEPVRHVLKKPYAVGTQWQALTTAYVLQRRNEVPKEIRRTHKPFPMTYTIEAVDAQVVVPAGRFERCLRVAGKATVRLYVDAQFAWRDIPLHTLEWYCPGAGLVRVEREELSPSRFMIGGKVILELMVAG